jgi:hypothetical protein
VKKLATFLLLGAAVPLMLFALVGSAVTGIAAQQPSAANQAASVPLSSALLDNPRLALSSSARGDLIKGIIDARLVTALAVLLRRHTLTVGVFKTGHSKMIVTDNGPGHVVSTHYYGRGADLMAVDGEPVSRTNREARQVVLELQALLADTRYELGQPWYDLVRPGTFTNRVHQDHIHVGLLH